MSEQEGAKPEATPEAPTEGAKPDEQLGDAGLRALQSERDARKALEAQVAQLRQGLASLAGTDDKSGDPLAALSARIDQMSSQLTAAEHSRKVGQVARENGITDPVDIQLLESATDEATLNLLVTRFKAHSTPGEQVQPGPLRPDLTQGGGAQGGDVIPLNGGGIESALKQALGIA